MQILIPDSWLRSFLDTKATPHQIQQSLSLCGPSIERLYKIKDDFVYDVEVTTNRVDCMSVIGLAREAAAILPRFELTASLKKDPFTETLPVPTAKTVDYLKVKVDPAHCPRFSAVLIQNVTVGPSPDWLIKRLELAGLRSLNNVVDISNYLMLELGQPVHTFDYDKITGHTMILRASKPGEKITTLDQKTFTLPGNDIVIEDGSGKLIDLCGIMGGLDSAVDNHTQKVLLFVQTYDPVHIRKTSMTLAQRTNAAVLFEKGLSSESVLPTLAAGIKMFSELTHGTPANRVIDLINRPSPISRVTLTTPLSQFVSTRLGVHLSYPETKAILSSLDFQVENEHEIVAPWYRSLDVTIPEDLVEEIARIYGYHHLPSQLMSGELPTQRDDKTFFWETKIKSALSHWGFTETYTYSFVSRTMESNSQALRVSNPLSSDWEYMRTLLTPSHLQVIDQNLGRVPEINLFEIAHVYLPRKNALPEEQLHLIVSTTNPDYYRLKGVLEALLEEMGIVGTILPIQIHTSALTCELNLGEIIPLAATAKPYHPISKFSPIIEDVNIRLTGPYIQLEKAIYRINPLISHIELIDKYQDKLTLRITYHSDTKQLSSSDIISIRQQLARLQLPL
jgi:phenylalanyl-tRNA synthetase beta chain